MGDIWHPYKMTDLSKPGLLSLMTGFRRYAYAKMRASLPRSLATNGPLRRLRG
jgi:hypothetical protein